MGRPKGQFEERKGVSETGSMTGPVVEHEGYFWLIIPLEPGGKHFIECAKGVSLVEDGFSKIFIARTVAEKIGIRHGSIIEINNYGGKLNMQLSETSTLPERR
jgi:hypothetical protein